MSLEQKIEELTAAIRNLDRNIVDGMMPILTRQTLQMINDDYKEREVEALAPAPAPVAAPAAPVAAPVMPAAPTFEPPAPVAPAASKAPFTDGKGLITYVMDVYKQLGAEKGAGIQGVLTEMGLTNVNDVRPTEYDTFFAKVEALK